MSETTQMTCYFCGKEITERWDYHNADPLVAPDENGFYGGCCTDCNNRYVRPARRIFWSSIPYLSEQDKQELDALVPYVQRMSLDDLRSSLDSEDPLAAFREYKKKCQHQEHRSWWKKIFK